MKWRGIALLLLSLGLAGGIFLSDQWSKSARMRLPAPEVSGAWIQTTVHRNFGMIANLPVPNMLTIAFMLAVSAIVVASLARAIMRGHVHASIALSLILGGALGNIMDRLTRGYVFDWILLFGRSVINIADIAIAAGIAWYLFSRVHRSS